MTAVSWEPIAVRPDQGAVVRDLSSAFGASAASSLRGVLPRHESEGRDDEKPTPHSEPGAVTSESPEPVRVDDDVQDSRNPRAPRAARAPRTVRTARTARPAGTPAPTPTGTRRRSGTRVPRRRFLAVEVRDRQHVDALLLAAARRGASSGRAFIDLVRQRSDGVFVLSERTVYHELRRLKKERLIQVRWSGDARRYRLTDLGERVLATRRRQLEAYAHGFDGVLTAADDGGRG